MQSHPIVTIFGAYGHTGRFVVAEALRRGWRPIVSGRAAEPLARLAAAHAGLDARPASVDEPASLDRALAGAAAVINCAGPFAETAGPVIEAALRARIAYLDVTAEVEVAAGVFEQYAERARAAGIAILPAVGFYGGLGDLLATAAIADGTAPDDIAIAYALDSWQPTAGTRATIRATSQRRGGRRAVFAAGRWELRADRAPVVEWTFPAPIGPQPVVAEFATADLVTISRQVPTAELRTYMTVAPLRDLADPGVPPPSLDETGRSAQTFLVEAVARCGRDERRAIARGRDIYAITAPIVLEAARRAIRVGAPTGVLSAGQLGDARGLLTALTPQLALELP